MNARSMDRERGEKRKIIIGQVFYGVEFICSWSIEKCLIYIYIYIYLFKLQTVDIASSYW